MPGVFGTGMVKMSQLSWAWSQEMFLMQWIWSGLEDWQPWSQTCGVMLALQWYWQEKVSWIYYFSIFLNAWNMQEISVDIFCRPSNSISWFVLQLPFFDLCAIKAYNLPCIRQSCSWNTGLPYPIRNFKALEIFIHYLPQVFIVYWWWKGAL